jgi:hypothetical protein
MNGLEFTQDFLGSKRVLVNGCSFTARSAYKNWPEYLPSRWRVTNIASHAAGNQWICDSTMVNTIKFDYDLVLVMWSGLTRIDMPVNETTWNQFWQFKNRNVLGLYYGHCGIGDNPEFPMADITKPIIKFGGTKELVFQSLLNMLKLQSWLESKNIDYRFMSFMNYWNDSYVENELQYPSVKNLELDALIDKINFDKFIFTDDAKNGIFELAKDQNLYASDNVHPNTQAGKLWADIVVQKIKNTETRKQ